jgi:hypothetical protein
MVSISSIQFCTTCSSSLEFNLGGNSAERRPKDPRAPPEEAEDDGGGGDGVHEEPPPMYCKNGCPLSDEQAALLRDPLNTILMYDSNESGAHRAMCLSLRVNAFMKYDTTLPREKGTCECCKCERDILRVRYSTELWNYAYMCDDPECNHYWLNDRRLQTIDVRDFPPVAAAADE